VLDGRIARRLGIASKFGYVLDGLADRAVHITAYLLLLRAGLLSEYLVWALVLRELCQYSVRLVEPDWLSLQAPLDRHVTRLYSAAVHAILIVEVGRAAAFPDIADPAYAIGVNIVLGAAATASYARILPRFHRAWQNSLL
jgi:phosphatidylglycerophosphate synthase